MRVVCILSTNMPNKDDDHCILIICLIFGRYYVSVNVHTSILKILAIFGSFIVYIILICYIRETGAQILSFIFGKNIKNR